MTTQNIQDELAALREQKIAEARAAVAAAEADLSRSAALNNAKARCMAECGEVSAALAEATDPAERALLIDLEARTHAAHADELSAAYRVFADQREGESNPATPGAPTQMSADLVVTSEVK